MRRTKLLALLAVAIALTGTTVTFAASSNTTTVTVSSSSSSIATVDSDLSSGPNGGTAPDWDPVVGEPGNVDTPGDLYKISPNTNNDLRITLYLDNPSSLSNSYSYLNLDVTIYEKDDSGAWQSKGDTATLSLTNGYVNFNVQQDYGGPIAVSIESGSYYADSDGNLDASFFLDVRAG